MEKRKITRTASVIPFIIVYQQSEMNVEKTNVFHSDTHKSPFESEMMLKTLKMHEV